jgi:signal transduction histidine kinase
LSNAALSVTATNSDSHDKPVGVAAMVARREVIAAVAIAGLVVGVSGGVLLGTSGHLVRPVAYGLQLSVIVVGTVGVALYWAVRRPGNRIALLLLAYAAGVAGISLQGAANPLVHSVGVLFEVPLFLLGYYIVFAFPEGRMSGALEKVLLAAAAWALLVSFLPRFFFSPVVSGAAPLAGCNATCPSNALMIADRPEVAAGFGKTEDHVAVVVAAAIVVGLLYRLATASGPRRRALLPVYVPALLVTIPFSVFHAHLAGLIKLDATAFNRVGWLLTAGRTALTFGFLVAIWQAMLFAGAALKAIIGRVDKGADAVELRALVAEALDDPPLELAFEVGRGSTFFVDSRGDPIDATSPMPGRSATALQHRGETVAYIVHDAGLETDPELVQAAGQAVLMALESGRLESELRSKTAELQRASGRIVAAGEAERRKIERDLHDGAQQRLTAIQIKLSLLRDRIDAAEFASELDEIGEDATAAVDDLRKLAHGIYPTVLRERGLGDGMRSLARTVPIHVEVVDPGIGRCAPTVETTVYFCLLEAIQNAMKHAGQSARVTVTLQRVGNDIVFEAADDGPGFRPDEASDTLGLTSMRDRVGAIGGELEIVSSPQAGTCVRGRVPDEVAARAEPR